MAQNKMVVGAIAFGVLLIFSLSVFTVDQTERALKLRFGRVVSADYISGLHFKVPFIDTIRKFDGRIQTLETMPQQFLTKEKKNLVVDAFVKWKIDNVVNYLTAASGNQQRMGQRLSELIADVLRSEFGKRTIQQVVSRDFNKEVVGQPSKDAAHPDNPDEKTDIMRSITDEANTRASEFGVKIIDVRVKKIELPKDVSTSVYRRMAAERERVAKELRSRGEAEAIRIQANADRESVEMIAKGERDAEFIRGQGDGKTAEIYALAFSKNPEFYALYRSLNAYKATFNNNKGDILLLQPDSDFFKYFKQFKAN